MWRPGKIQLPPELVDTIIDFSCSDLRTLANCSLVSKTWLPASRLHLFEHAELTSPKFATFLALFDGAHCSILPYIRTVTISGSGWKHLYTAVASLTMLSRLETLRFVKVNFNLEMPAIFPQFHSLNALEVSTSSFETFAYLTGVVALFPSIESLRIDNSEWHSHSGRSLSPAPSTLRAVVVGRSLSKVPIFNWLAGSTSHLNTVSLTLSRLTEIRPTVQYLRDLGPSLEHLELTDFLGSWASAPLACKMDLSKNTNIKSLHFHLYHRQPSSWIPVLLSQIRSVSFTDFTLTVHGDPKVVLRTATVQRRIEIVVEHSQYMSLKRVHLLLDGKQPADAGLDVIKRLSILG